MHLGRALIATPAPAACHKAHSLTQPLGRPRRRQPGDQRHLGALLAQRGWVPLAKLRAAAYDQLAPHARGAAGAAGAPPAAAPASTRQSNALNHLCLAQLRDRPARCSLLQLLPSPLVQLGRPASHGTVHRPVHISGLPACADLVRPPQPPTPPPAPRPLTPATRPLASRHRRPGFTVFLERKILGRLHGEAFFQFEAAGGLLTLQATVNQVRPPQPPPLAALAPAPNALPPPLKQISHQRHGAGGAQRAAPPPAPAPPPPSSAQITRSPRSFRICPAAWTRTMHSAASRTKRASTSSTTSRQAACLCAPAAAAPPQLVLLSRLFSSTLPDPSSPGCL
jgi:hypothetical protein